MKNLFTILSLLSVLCSFDNPHLMAQSWLWSTPIEGTAVDLTHKVPTGPLGDFYVTGSFTGSASFGNTMLHAVGDCGIYLAKYSAEGNLIWAVRAGGSEMDEEVPPNVKLGGAVAVSGIFYKAVPDTAKSYINKRDVSNIINCLDAPENVVSSDATPSSAVISWEPVNSSSLIDYQYRYRIRGGNWVFGSSADSKVLLTGLVPNSSYEFIVRNQCEPGNSPRVRIFFATTGVSSDMQLTSNAIRQELGPIDLKAGTYALKDASESGITTDN